MRNFKIKVLFLLGISLNSCFEENNSLNEPKLKDQIIREGEYKNGRFTGRITEIDPFGDTLSVKEYVEGRLGMEKTYNSSGKVSMVFSHILGSTNVNSFLDFDSSGHLIQDNSNIRLYEKKNKLVVMFYKPYADELELIFKTNLSNNHSKIIEEKLIKPFKKKRIEIELKKEYYTKGRLNMIVDQIWQQSENIQTSHATFIQLDQHEKPDYYNIDPIDIK
jgi:antitoxin component YwqK of YwqJK toxin-antitoxin module